MFQSASVKNEEKKNKNNERIEHKTKTRTFYKKKYI